MSGNWTSEEGETEHHQWILLGIGALVIGAVVILVLLAAAWIIYKIWNSRKNRRATHPTQTNHKRPNATNDANPKKKEATIPSRAGILRGELERGLAPAFKRDTPLPNTTKLPLTNKVSDSTVGIKPVAKPQRPCRMNSATSPLRESNNRSQRRARSPSLVALRSGGILHQQHSLPALTIAASSAASRELAKSPSPIIRPLETNSVSTSSNGVAKLGNSPTASMQPMSKQSSNASAVIYPSSPSASADIPRTGSTDTARSSLSVTNGDAASLQAERRPSRSQIIEQQLVGLEPKLVPRDREAEDEQREKIKKAIGPPEPKID